MTLQLHDILEGIETTKTIVVESLKKYPQFKTDKDCEMEIRKLTVTEINKINTMRGGLDFDIPMDVMDKIMSKNTQDKEKISKELAKALKKEKMSFSSSEQEEKLFKSKLETIKYGLDVMRKGSFTNDDIGENIPDMEVLDEIYNKIMLFTTGGEEDLEKAADDFPEESQE